MLYKKNKQNLTKENFQNPGSEYRAAPFWAWNCKMNKDEIDNALDTIVDMGMGGGHIHCRTGMDNPYLSDEFMELVKYTNEECKRRKLLTYLYDEDRWPSGFGGGYVTREHKYRMRFLLFTPHRQGITQKLDNKLSADGQAVRSNERVFLGRYQVKLENGYMTDYKKITETDQIEAEYNEWFAYLEVSGDHPWFNNQAYVNTLDKKAIERFVQVTHEKYYEVLGTEFGKSIPSIFTDEPQFSHKKTLGFADEKTDLTIPYTDDFEETFQLAYGHSLLEHLPEIFWETGQNQVSQIRYQYHDHIAERFAEAYADTIGMWCKKHGIMLTGHMMEEPTLETQTAALGEAMRSYRSFQLPGVDMLCDRRELSTVKQAESAAHQFGREGVLSELYGVTNWDFDFRGHKLQGDWQAALGVTVRVPHLTWTSMAGEAKRDYPASIGYQSPWYKEYSLIENYFARVNSVLTRGKPHIRLGVIHPIESYWLFWGPKEQTIAVREEMDERFIHLINWLLYGTIDFDFIAESLIGQLCTEQENTASMQVGEMKYDVILVPNCLTLRSTTLDALEKFRKRGGRIIFAGEVPTLENAVPSSRGARLAEQCEKIAFGKNAILNSLTPIREIEIKEEDGSSSLNLIYQMREENEKRWVFISHVQREIKEDQNHMVIGGIRNKMSNEDIPVQEHLKITITGEWKLTLYDAMTGEIKKLSAEYKGRNTILRWDMYDHDSLMLQLEPGRSEKEYQEEVVEKIQRECVIPDTAVITRSEQNVSILDMAEYRFDDGVWNPEEEVLRIDNKFRKLLGYPLRMEAFAQPWVNDKEEQYNHTLSLLFTVYTETALKDLFLAMETDEDTRIYLNAQEIENKREGWYTDHSIQKIRLNELVEGENKLQVDIPYNSQVNIEAMFLLGDFSVKVLGRKQILGKPVKEVGYGDMTRQGCPFYGGNITYRIPFTSIGGNISVQSTFFRAPVIKVAVDNVIKGYIAFSPYTVQLGELAAGNHELQLTIYGNRVNTFGAIHNCNRKEFWFGPNVWRSNGAEWSYEYQLKEWGILKAPIITEIFIKD